MKKKQNKLEKIEIFNIIVIIIEVILLIIEIILEILNNKLIWIPLIIMLSIWVIFDYINELYKKNKKK